MQNIQAAAPLCHICGRGFARGEHLRRHVRTHTKEKPYLCHCGRSFARRDLLRRHERISHNESVAHIAVAATPRHRQLALPSPHTPGLAMPSVYLGRSTASPPATPTAPLEDSSSAINLDSQDQDHSIAAESFNPTDTNNCDDVGKSLLDFLDTVGLNFDYDYPAFTGCGIGTTGPSSSTSFTAAAATPPWLSSSGEGQSLHLANTPALPGTGRIPNTAGGDDDFHELKPRSQPCWKVSEAQRQQLTKSLEASNCLQDFVLPSRLSMARYIAGYFDGFNHHHPFIHMPTFCVGSYTDTPELPLALMAVGAVYRYEKTRALVLYHTARRIVLSRMQKGELSLSRAQGCSCAAQRMWMDTVRTLLMLATYASWQRDQSLVRESLEYQGLLARYIRDSGMAEAGTGDGDDWQEWVRLEADRRTKLSAFCFLNLQSIAFNLPPVILAGEIDLQMPTSCKEWTAASPSEWLQARSQGPKITTFQKAFTSILQGDVADIAVVSPLGNLVTIHALIQKLIMMWQLSAGLHMGRTGLWDSTAFEEYLSRWRQAWQKAPESVLDYNNSKDSLSWSATSLLALAHVRVHFDLGRNRQLLCGNPSDVAKALFEAPPPQRGAQLLHALLHSGHVINIPVQLGLSHLADCQAYFWSLQHAFCILECAVFLSKWLGRLAAEYPSVALDTTTESRMVQWIWSIVVEARSSTDNLPADVDVPAAPVLEITASTSDILWRLSINVVDIVSRMFKHCNSAWPIMSIIGESLEEYANLLRTSNEQRRHDR